MIRITPKENLQDRNRMHINDTWDGAARFSSNQASGWGGESIGAAIRQR
jgi:hypothetical protein